jgi:hypothetical protein
MSGERTRLACWRLRLAIANFACVYFFRSFAISANWASAASRSSVISKARTRVGEVQVVFDAWKARPLLHPRYGIFEPEDV